MILPLVCLGTPHFMTCATMLNFGKAFRILASPAASQTSIAADSDVNTKLEYGGWPKQLERLVGFGNPVAAFALGTLVSFSEEKSFSANSIFSLSSILSVVDDWW